jgi:hypothetical protein
MASNDDVEPEGCVVGLQAGIPALRESGHEMQQVTPDVRAPSRFRGRYHFGGQLLSIFPHHSREGRRQ